MAHPAATAPIDRLLEKLSGVRAAGASKWMAKCPAHDDKQASLSLKVGNDGRAVMFCHARCPTTAIVAALGLAMSDLFVGGRPSLEVTSTAPAQGVTTRQRLVKAFDYRDANGDLLFQVCRMAPKKEFPQRRPTAAGGWEWGLGSVAPVLYRLPEIIEAVAAERRIFVVEGEKDADRLAELGLSATTSPMGAGKWRDEYADTLAGAVVVVLPDNDEPGHAHAKQVADSLRARDCTVKVVPLPGVALKGDVSDWLAAAGTVQHLEELIGRTADWKIGDEIPPPLGPMRFKLLSVAELEALPPIEWLLGESGAGVLPEAALFSIFGAPEAGKSFIAADVACSIACRRLDLVPVWFGNTIRRGPVIYVAAEGGRGFGQRIRAWRQRHDVRDDELDLRFILEPVNLYGPDDISHILRAVDLLKEPPALVFFDTLARSMVGGDENSAQDVGYVIDRADRIKRLTGGTVGFAHHTRKEGDVERGSGALRGGVDTLWLAREEEDGSRVLTCEKQKDAEHFHPITFYLATVGDSCVVTAHAPVRTNALTANQRAALKTLADVFPSGATSTEWLAASGLAQRTFYRVRGWLVPQGYASEVKYGQSTRYAITPSGHWALNGNIGTLNG